MSPILYPFYAILNLALLVWGVHLWRRTGRSTTLMIVAVTFGLVYDNAMLALGLILAERTLLYWLSVPRFVLHQLILPSVIWVAFEQLRLAGHGWAHRLLQGA